MVIYKILWKEGCCSIKEYSCEFEYQKYKINVQTLFYEKQSSNKGEIYLNKKEK